MDATNAPVAGFSCGGADGELSENIGADVTSSASKCSTGRLRSLDALRGFDMFWIVGGATLAKTLAGLTGWAWLQWFAGQMYHPAWIGFTAWDLIFPLFLFLAGVAMPY